MATNEDTISQLQDEVKALEVSQAVQGATLTGAQATQAAAHTELGAPCSQVPPDSSSACSSRSPSAALDAAKADTTQRRTWWSGWWITPARSTRSITRRCGAATERIRPSHLVQGYQVGPASPGPNDDAPGREIRTSSTLFVPTILVNTGQGADRNRP